MLRPATLAVLILGVFGAASLGAEPRAWDLSPDRKRYSQFNEELVIRHFFQDREAGIFVDVGCYHWKQHSTSYYLEAHLGWSGVGVDALPWLRNGYEKNRKATRFFHYIVSDTSGETQTLFAAGPLSSTDEARTDAWFPDRKLEPLEIQTITLDDLLEEAEITKIDFLSMDIEGGEARALRGFDIARFRPALVCIEVAAENRDFVAKYFAQHGYERLAKYEPYDSLNQYYAPRGGT